MATQEEIDRLYQQGQGIQQGIDTAKQMADSLSLGSSGMNMGDSDFDKAQANPPGINATSITSDNIEPPAEEPDYGALPPEQPVAGEFATPPLEMTESEKKGQTLTEELMELNKSLMGESAYRTEQETTQDIAGKQKIVNDLTNQLTTLKNQYDQIPLQMQNQAEGRGITAGGLAPHTMAAQRKVAIDSLGVSALLQAANGNLSTAQSLVDRAVAAKYDPIREEINVKMTNLDLILNSPKATIEDKNRAQKQLDAQNNALKAIEDAEAMAKEIWNIATTAATNTANFVPTAKYPTATLALQAIQKAKTKEEALQIAQEAGFLTEKVTPEIKTSLTEIDGRKVLVSYDNQGNPTNYVDLGASGSGGGETDFNYAEELTGLNPEASYEDLFVTLQGKTKMSDSEIKNYLGAKGFKPKEEKEFLTKDFFAEKYGGYGSDSLKDAAEKYSKETTTGWGPWRVGDEEKFLTKLLEVVEQYRKIGYTDKEILEKML